MAPVRQNKTHRINEVDDLKKSHAVNHMLAALSILSISILGSCSGCENKISEQKVSPDKSVKAVVFSRNCGATVGYNIQVSVIPAGASLPDDPGNVLIMEPYTNSGRGVAVEWRDSRKLAVWYPRDAKIFIQKQTCQVHMGPFSQKSIEVIYIPD